METTDPPKKKRRGGTRRKTGCYTCKSRHSRCDEKKPVCSNCERLNLECRPSDFIAPSSWNAPMDFQTQPPQQTTIVSASSPVDVPASTWDIFKTHIPGMDQISSSDDSPPIDPSLLLSFPTPASAPASSGLCNVTLTDETAYLLQSNQRTVATWMDLWDHNNTYQIAISRFTLSSPLVFHGVCALQAKYLSVAQSAKGTSWVPVAQYHYGEALRLLIELLNSSTQQDHALTATILLVSYEVISSLSQEHRRHLYGAMLLIKSHGVTARSACSIDRANFWNYVRHDIGAALATKKPVILNPEEWNVHWVEGERREDVLGNHLLWILAKTINVVFGPDSETDEGKTKRHELFLEAESWRTGLSDTFIGVPYGEVDEEGFKKVYFTVPDAAAAAFFYHITRILLYAEPTLQDPTYADDVQDQATRTANILLSDFPNPVRVFATHGIYYAAKHINGIARKARIWNVLNDVETELGYHTRTTVKQLQKLVEQST